MHCFRASETTSIGLAEIIARLTTILPTITALQLLTSFRSKSTRKIVWDKCCSSPGEVSKVSGTSPNVHTQLIPKAIVTSFALRSVREFMGEGCISTRQKFVKRKRKTNSSKADLQLNWSERCHFKELRRFSARFGRLGRQSYSTTGKPRHCWCTIDSWYFTQFFTDTKLEITFWSAEMWFRVQHFGLLVSSG